MKIPHHKRDFFIPIAFLTSILLSAICFVSHYTGTSTVLSKSLSVVVSPLTSATKSVFDSLSSVRNYFSDIDSLKKENEELKKQNKALTEQNNSLLLLQSENDSLYKFLELKKEHNDYKFVNSNIVSKSTSGYSSDFTIDKGSFHGIEAGMPIITDAGTLVGITSSVDFSSTRCKSILSYDLNIGIYDEQTGETGILSGYFDTFFENKCTISPIPENAEMKVGDRILTSGLGETYPRNLIIGTVDSFVPDNGTHARRAIITLDESILSSDSIMVITSFERVYE